MPVPGTGPRRGRTRAKPRPARIQALDTHTLSLAIGLFDCITVTIAFLVWAVQSSQPDLAIIHFSVGLLYKQGSNLNLQESLVPHAS